MVCERCKKLFAFSQASSVPFEPYTKGLGGDTRPIHNGTQTATTTEEAIEPLTVGNIAGEAYDHSAAWWKTRLADNELLDFCSQSASSHCPTCSMMVSDISPSIIEALFQDRSPGDDPYLVYKLSNKYLLTHASSRSRKSNKQAQQVGQPFNSSILSVWLQISSRLIPITSLHISANLSINIPKAITDGANRTTGSTGSFDLISYWLRTCDRCHRQCKAEIDKEFSGPSRLVDLREYESTNKVRLYCRQDGEPVVTYMTLSHRCGGQRKGILTAENLEDYTREIYVSSLPNTHKDAIEIALALNICYLWIDSLCIIQDSVDDWRRESALMGSVFKQSYCTVAASWATSEDEGCFVTRAPLRTQVHAGRVKTDCLSGYPYPPPGNARIRRSIEDHHRRSKLVKHTHTRRNYQELLQRPEIYTDDPAKNHEIVAFPGLGLSSGATKNLILSVQHHEPKLWKRSVEASPLNKRAWVLQERLLSPRTVYYCRDQIFFECKSCKACESIPEMQWKYIQRGPYSDSPDGQPMDGKHELHGPDTSAPYKRWHEIVEMYTDTDLSYPSDKLVALSGLAKEAQKAGSDNYLAGLWRDKLQDQLLWYTKFPRPHEKLRYRAPSWSWASIDGSVGHLGPKPNDSSIDYHILVSSAQTWGIDEVPNSFGELKYGHVSIRGWTRKLNSWFKHNDTWCLLLSQELSEDDDGGAAEFFPDRVAATELQGLVCLPVCSFTSETRGSDGKPWSEWTVGLVLKPTGEFKGEWTRVGSFRASGWWRIGKEQEIDLSII